MTTQAVNDWIVEVGWDDSKVVAGSKRLQATMSKLARIEKINQAATKGSGKREVSAAQKVNALETKRLRAQETLLSLKKMGGDSKEITALQNKINATKTVSGYNNAILATQKAILVTRQKQYELDKKEVNTVKKKAVTKESPLEFSKVKLVNSVAVEKQLVRLSKLSSDARAALSQVPQGASFDSQRNKIEAVVKKLDELKQSYKQAGTTKAFESISPDMMRAKQSVSEVLSEVKMLNRELNKKMGGSKEQVADFSKVKLIDPIAVERQIIRLNNLQMKASTALSRVPDQPKFGLQRENLKGLISDIEKLKDSYRGVGTQNAFRQLAPAYDRLNASSAMYVRHANEINRVMNAQKFAADKLKNSVHNLAASYLSVFTAIEGGRRFLEIGAEFESFDAMMLGVSGTAKQAGEDFGFVSRQALRLGADLTESTRSFAKFGTAAVLSDFDTGATKKMFTQIMEVNRAFGLTKERQGLAFLAFEQMLSKGVVSMEELRRQLGEQWYGAFTQAAFAMNMTGQELAKLVETGTLASTDFIPKFLNQMNNFVTSNGMLEASMKKVGAEQGRFNVRLKEGINEGFTAGRDNFFGFFKDMRTVLEDNMGTMRSFGFIFGGAMRVISISLRTISPLIGVVGNAFDTLRLAIGKAMDTTKDWKDLTAVEAGFRGIGIAVTLLNIGLLYLAKYTEDVARWFGVSEDGASSLTKQLGALGVGLLFLIPAFKAFRMIFMWTVWKPIKLVYDLAKGLVGVLTKVGKLSGASTVAAQVVEGVKGTTGKIGSEAAATASQAGAGGMKGISPFKLFGRFFLGKVLGPLGALMSVDRDNLPDVIWQMQDLFKAIQTNAQSGPMTAPAQGATQNLPETRWRTIQQTNHYSVTGVTDPQEVVRLLEQKQRQSFAGAIDTVP